MHNNVIDVPQMVAEHAPAAASWLMNFWPDVDVELCGNQALLSSADVCEDRLRLLWTTALANELSFAQADKQRREIVRELIE